MTFKNSKSPRVEISAPIGYRTAAILKVNGKCSGIFESWEEMDTHIFLLGLRPVPWYKKLAVMAGFDITLA